MKTSDKVIEDIGAGGLSGQSIHEKSLTVIRYLSERLPEETALIGVGGIHGPEQALSMLESGADLVQVYSGLIYEGPGLVKSLKKAISRHF